MPKYRVKIVRTTIEKEEGHIEVEAESDTDAMFEAVDSIELNGDLIEFENEWLDECYCRAEGAELITAGESDGI